MSVHLCDEACRVINRDFTMVCKMTGKCYGQYMSRNYHNEDVSEMLTHRPVCSVVKRQRAGVDFAKIAPTVEATYTLLMHSAARTEIEGGDGVVGTHHHKKRRLLTAAPRDKVLARAVCSAVSRIVRVVTEYKPFLKLNTVIIGALYLMQHGKCFKSASGTEWDIPRFDHLQRYLPSISDLPRFGFNRALVRVGKNVIMSAVRGQ